MKCSPSPSQQDFSWFYENLCIFNEHKVKKSLCQNGGSMTMFVVVCATYDYVWSCNQFKLGFYHLIIITKCGCSSLIPI
jgi:hypothetical protein